MILQKSKKILQYSIAFIAAMQLGFFGKTQSADFSLIKASRGLTHLSGKKEKASFPYVTAGLRLYAIGNQAGGFPAIGFHVAGKMGGVWQQPIKLLDGFSASITDMVSKADYPLNNCIGFTAYPFTSTFLYNLKNAGLQITRTQFVPDDKPVLVVEFAVNNTSGTDKKIILKFKADVNLMPVWLGERSGMIDSTDIQDGFIQKTIFFKDKKNTWYAGITSDADNLKFEGTEKTVYQGKGIAGILSSEISIPKGKTKLIKFFISGSENNKSEITANLTFVKNNIAALFKAKQQRYSELENTATINIPDTLMMKAYRWGKYASDWLKREVPDLGKGMSAGLPDYPWFFSNDQAYTFNALVGTVPPDIFFDSWKMLQTVSDKANNNSGRIIHEASTNGAVYDKGRMEESQLHIIASWNIYKWTGNKTFLKEQYELGEKIWKWLQANETGAGYIKGYGGVEIEGLNDVMLDVQVHTQQFLEVMSKMASVLNNESAAKDYLAKAYFLKQKINEDWWVPEDNRYADFISSKQKAIAIIDSALSKRVHSGRNEWARTKLTQLRENILAGKYNNKGYNVYYNTSGILPLESGIADSAKAKAALQNIDFFTNKFGLYITGIERPDDISMDEGNFEHDKEFNYNRAVMPAATANLIIAACQYGLPDSALKYVHKVLNAFSYATPGTTYEISPDYGMFVQAWNIRAYNIPLIHFFFGIDPTAAEQTVQIHPQMPAQWNYASIKNVLIGNNKLSIDFKKIDKRSIYIIVSEQKGWKEIFTLPAGAHNVSVNGKPVSNKTATIELTKRKNVVEYAEGAQHERKTVI